MEWDRETEDKYIVDRFSIKYQDKELTNNHLLISLLEALIEKQPVYVGFENGEYSVSIYTPRTDEEDE